jgi:hypothetical protein
MDRGYTGKELVRSLAEVNGDRGIFDRYGEPLRSTRNGRWWQSLYPVRVGSVGTVAIILLIYLSIGLCDNCCCIQEAGKMRWR